MCLHFDQNNASIFIALLQFVGIIFLRTMCIKLNLVGKLLE